MMHTHLTLNWTCILNSIEQPAAFRRNHHQMDFFLSNRYDQKGGPIRRSWQPTWYPVPPNPVTEKLFRCPTELEVLGWKTSVFEGSDWPTEKKMQVTLPGSHRNICWNLLEMEILWCLNCLNTRNKWCERRQIPSPFHRFTTFHFNIFQRFPFWPQPSTRPTRKKLSSCVKDFMVPLKLGMSKTDCRLKTVLAMKVASGCRSFTGFALKSLAMKYICCTALLVRSNTVKLHLCWEFQRVGLMMETSYDIMMVVRVVLLHVILFCTSIGLQRNTINTDKKSLDQLTSP